MKKLLLIASLAFGISSTSALANRALDISDLAATTASNPLDGNVVEVHKKHKKYKRYSKKHYKKHHRKHYAKKRHKHKKHRRHYHSHRHHQQYGRILLNLGGLTIQVR